MLNKAATLKGYKLDSLDGEIGKVEASSAPSCRIHTSEDTIT